MELVSRLMDATIRPAAMKTLLTWERLESGVVFDPLSRKMRANPYPFYEELRRKDPVHRMRLQPAWVLSNYADVDLALRDHRRFGNSGKEYNYIPYNSLLDIDPTDHTRIRGLVTQGFTPRSVAALEPRIQQTVDGLLDDLEGRERIDLIRDFAYPLPITVIAELMGVPVEDRDQFDKWSRVVALSVDPLLNSGQIRQVRQAVEELFEYLEGIAEARRKEPREDLISAMANAEEDGQRLSRDDLLINLVLVLVAGNETTRNLIGNGTLALLKNPSELQRLRDNPGLLDSAIDEFLRYDSPVQLDSRFVKEEVEIGGKRISPGQLIVCVLGAANRDPEVFPNPDALDIGRAPGNHMAFGRGIHYCLGAPLAKLEARIAFTALLSRFKSLSLAEEPRYRNQVTLRGLEALWLEAEWAG